MSLKDNFNQAVKELLKRDGLVGSDLSKNSRQKSELDRYLDTPPQPAKEETSRPVDEIPEVENLSYTKERPQRTYAADDYGTSQSAGMSSNASGGFGGGNNPPPPPSETRAMGRQPETPYFETEETTVISRNTIIDGNIRSFANITIEGSVKGDVQITKNAAVSGKIVGDLACNNATMTGSSMQGNVVSKGQVKLDRDSLILGDISAQYLDMNGKIKGNVDIGGKAEFKSDAIIFGNINASTITVLDGATIQGFVNTTFLQETASNVFPDAIAVSDT
ncbi:MAG: polymer-forming cytoskeletal protein [Oscillospiraceae bacterium]|nr:polymer-forming cytoskeletal protein [Oscillospiraceae bacterium]